MDEKVKRKMKTRGVQQEDVEERGELRVKIKQ